MAHSTGAAQTTAGHPKVKNGKGRLSDNVRQGLAQRWSQVGIELTHHLPYTIVGTLIAMAGVWWFGTQQLGQSTTADLQARCRVLFHLFHSLHICLSAIGTTALFWRRTRRIGHAVLAGTLGTMMPCALSDYIIPYTGGRFLGQTMDFHICIINHPQLFFSFMFLGIISGLWAEEKLATSQFFSHGVHVFVSSTSSLLYLMSFGFMAWISDVRYVLPAFIIIVIAVWLPCCISDIVVPVSTIGHEHDGHSHG